MTHVPVLFNSSPAHGDPAGLQSSSHAASDVSPVALSQAPTAAVAAAASQLAPAAAAAAPLTDLPLADASVDSSTTDDASEAFLEEESRDYFDATHEFKLLPAATVAATSSRRARPSRRTASSGAAPVIETEPQPTGTPSTASSAVASAAYRGIFDEVDDGSRPPGHDIVPFLTLAELRSFFLDGGVALLDDSFTPEGDPCPHARWDGAVAVAAAEADEAAQLAILRQSPNAVARDLAAAVSPSAPAFAGAAAGDDGWRARVATGRPPESFASLDEVKRFRKAAVGSIKEAAHLLDVFDHYAAYHHATKGMLKRQEAQIDRLEWKARAVLGDMRRKFLQREMCTDENQQFLTELLRTQVRLITQSLNTVAFLSNPSFPNFVYFNSPVTSCVLARRFWIQALGDPRVDFTRVRDLCPTNRHLPNPDKVRAALKQCARDWSVEGEKERASCYGPILEVRNLNKLLTRSPATDHLNIPVCLYSTVTLVATIFFSVYEKYDSTQNISNLVLSFLLSESHAIRRH